MSYLIFGNKSLRRVPLTKQKILAFQQHLVYVVLDYCCILCYQEICSCIFFIFFFFGIVVIIFECFLHSKISFDLIVVCSSAKMSREYREDLIFYFFFFILIKEDDNMVLPSASISFIISWRSTSVGY